MRVNETEQHGAFALRKLKEHFLTYPGSTEEIESLRDRLKTVRHEVSHLQSENAELKSSDATAKVNWSSCLVVPCSRLVIMPLV